MIKLLEPSLKIQCRQEDVNDIKGITSDIENEFKTFMSEKTGRDEYECTLTVIDDTFLNEN